MTRAYGRHEPERADGTGTIGAELQDTVAAMGAEFDHVAVAAPRLRDLVALYEGVLGGVGVVGGDHRETGFRAVQVQFGAGLVELLEPLAGSSFLDSFFARYPQGGLHHVTFRVPSIERALEIVRAAGLEVHGLSRVGAVQSEFFLHPKATHGVLVQIIEKGPDYPPTGVVSSAAILAGRGMDGNGLPST
ncbi:MAG TPA: VOC family protein [Mycobacteriales bacterium]|jgi:methylmalonyl-CoA/ethylmalonyl-CoA epimerase|nr:VOC family protein [Mycobacteriales bacterium]